jgi:uncharacterized GH25 family protein
MSLMRWFSITLLSLLMIACGGGGSIEKDTSGGGGTNTDYELVLSTSSASGGSLSISNPITITAKLTNDGAPVANNLVTFSNDEFSNFATDRSQLTDSNGEAKVTITANGAGGAGTITATAEVGESTVNGSVPYAAIGDGGLQMTVEVVDGAGAEINKENPLSVSKTGLIKVSLRKDGQPLDNKLVTVSELLLANITDSGTAVTDAAGLAELEISVNDSRGWEPFTVDYEDPDNDDTASASGRYYSAGVAAGAGIQLMVAVQDADENTINEANPLSANKQGEVVVTLLEDGQPLSNELVTVSSGSKAATSPSDGISNTDTTGTARITLIPNTIKGWGEVTATFGEGAAAVTNTARYYSDSDPNFGASGLQLTLIGFNAQGQTSNALSAQNPLTIQATLSLNGDAIGNANVLLTVNEFGVLNPSSGSVLTNSAGIATITLSDNSVSGAGRVTARYEANNGEVVTQNFNFNSAGDGGVNISIVDILSDDGTPISTQINGNNRLAKDNNAKVTVLLVEDGQPLSGQLVTFTTDNVATMLPQNGRAVTNSDGRASIIIAPTTQDGIGEIYAEYGSFSTPRVTFASEGAIFEETGDYQFDILLLVGCPDDWDALRATDGITPEALATCPDPITNVPSTELVDVYIKLTSTATSIAVEDAIVTVETDKGQVLPSSGQVLTDQQGVALLKLQPGDSGGAGSITAKYKDDTGVKKLLCWDPGFVSEFK